MNRRLINEGEIVQGLFRVHAQAKRLEYERAEHISASAAQDDEKQKATASTKKKESCAFSRHEKRALYRNALSKTGSATKGSETTQAEVKEQGT